MGHQRLLEKMVRDEKHDRLGENIPMDSPGITNFLVTSELDANASPQEAMIFAMKEEEKAFNFYSDLKNHFTGTELENLFNKLANEERGHKIKLEKEYEAHVMKDN